MKPKGQDAPQLTLLAKALKRRWPLVLFVPLIAVAVALALTLNATKQYEATSKVYISEQNPVQGVLGTQGQSPSDPERDLNSRVQLITTQAVADRVRKQLGLRTSPSALLKHVKATIEGTSDIVSIKVRESDPAAAARIANAFATEYVASRLAATRGVITQAAQLAQRQLTSLSPAERNGPQGRQLAQRLRELQISAALQTGGIEIVGRARPPAGAASPRPKLAGAVAGVLGLLVGILLAVGLELADQRIRDIDELDHEKPILGTIPHFAGDRAEGAHGVAVREAYATLATNLRFLNLGREVSSLTITSAGPREGKTTTCLGLAGALAKLGLRVVALEGDLRRPSFRAYTGISGMAGLSTVLAHVSDLEGTIVDVDAETWRPLEPDAAATGPYFSVVPCGPVPPNPLGLLSSPDLVDVVKRTRAMCDVLIIDTPPVGLVNDAVAVAELVDGIAVVGRLRHSRRDALQRALELLGRLPTPVLGFVATDAPRRTRRYYGYGEEYRSESLDIVLPSDVSR